MASLICCVPIGRSNHPVKPRLSVVAGIRAGAPPMPELEHRKKKRPDDVLGQLVTVRMPVGQWLHLLQWIGPLRSGRVPKDVIGATDLIRNALGRAMKDDAIRRARAKGSAEECSAERSRAHQRQGVAPAEGRAWETPAMRRVNRRMPSAGDS